jgi:hypothetical protein
MPPAFTGGKEFHYKGTARAAPLSMNNRRKVRVGLKVIHRHRVGNHEFRRVSELVFVGGRARAILGWVDVGGVRAPIYLCDLDPAKLQKAAAAADTYYYDGVTVDPRYEDFGPVPEQRKTI